MLKSHKITCILYGGVLMLAILLTVLHCNTILSAYATEAGSVNLSVNNSTVVLEITVPDSVTIDLTPSSDNNHIAFDTASLNIGVGTNNLTGYSLSMTASNTSLTRTASITDGSGSTTTPTIAPLSTTGSATGYSESDYESSTYNTYTLNTWGYKKSSDTKYMPMASGNISLASTNSAANANTTTLNFAAKVDSSKPAGTYATILSFTAVANATSISSIDQLIYMQDFATLTSDEITAVKNSMATGEQKQLKDKRDDKTYYISKLADGNIWMTQNLDHDIVTTAGYYTPANTDITANWTPSLATYANSTSTWQWNTTAPESYDPGDKCWNGSYSSTSLANLATCAQKDNHYHIGNYYNWSAAVANNNTSAYGASVMGMPNLPDTSICPAGWSLPRASTGSDTFYSLTNGRYANGTAISASPVYFVPSGRWYGSAGGVGSSGYYWSAVSYNSDSAYYLHFYSSGVRPSDYSGRYNGFPVRCVARPLTTVLTGAEGGSGGGGND